MRAHRRTRRALEHRRFHPQRVYTYYWNQDLNCTTTTLRILSEHLNVPLCPQTLDAALGMHGAGGDRAQCGLVEGALMFLGIWGRRHDLPDCKIVELCKAYGQQFEARFGSLVCAVLRPEAFSPDNPPHLCEGLTCRAQRLNVEFISEAAQRLPFRPPARDERSHQSAQKASLRSTKA